jgi:hypothetical protein
MCVQAAGRDVYGGASGYGARPQAMYGGYGGYGGAPAAANRIIVENLPRTMMWQALKGETRSHAHTHTHTDQVRHLFAFSRRSCMPMHVYAHTLTFAHVCIHPHRCFQAIWTSGAR